MGAALRALPKPSIVISYTDPTAGHAGTIYKACNFLYCGLTEKRTNWTIDGAEKHGVSIADEFKGAGRADAMRAKYGERFSLKPRPRKHRYVFICAGRKDRRAIMSALRFELQSYPRAAA
jgi:hypothetical protein